MFSFLKRSPWRKYLSGIFAYNLLYKCIIFYLYIKKGKEWDKHPEKKNKGVFCNFFCWFSKYWNISFHSKNELLQRTGSWTRSEFLNLDTTDIWGWITVVGAVLCSSTLGLYLLDANNTLSNMTTKNLSRPNFFWRQKSTLIENPWIKWLEIPSKSKSL